MSPFWSGFLGALAALFALFALRRILWLAFWRRRWHRHGRFSGRGLGYLFGRLGTRPEQEAALRAEAESLFAEMSGFRGEVPALRAELAALLTGPSLDEAAVSATLEKPLARLGELRTRVAAAVARIHATLDATQRERLAELVRSGPHRHHHGFRHGPHGRGPHPAAG